MTTLSARKSARILTAKLGERSRLVTSAAPVVDVIDPNENTGQALHSSDLKSGLPAVSSRGSESLAFHRLASKNPALLSLVATLDLEETGSTLIRPEPLPPLPDQLVTEPLNPKLKEIAQSAFARGRSYLLTDAVSQLASITGVPADRARNGISKMCAQGILSQALNDEYYLTESTPF